MLEKLAFPCLDEPLLKATFDVAITAPSELTVLSNMPLKSKTLLNSKAFTLHEFHTTPKMSTYLVAWALGEFEYIEGHTEKSIYPIMNGSPDEHQQLPIRVFTAEGKSEQGRFALDIAAKVIDYYSSLFDIPYPLPKLDLLCVEAYSHNAMENFSLITFRPTALLLEGDAKDSNPTVLQNIAYVVSHEIAHQWFGNLVTMKWWDELWLNEGFATWIGYHAISKFFPEWDVPSLVMLKSHEPALRLDSLKESHPVKVSIENAKDIDQVFDTISYLKGCSIIEMISEFLGPEQFLKGVAMYLERNKFSNATMEDLLSSLSEVSGIDVLSRLENWILKLGYPLLSVEKLGEKKLKLTQGHYLSTATQDKSSTIWWIPLMMGPNTGQKDQEFFDETMLLEHDPHELVIFNSQGHGFYRVEYKDKDLLCNICENLGQVSSRGKIGLLSDIQTTESVKVLLSTLEYFGKVQDSTEHYVWAMVFDICERLLTLFYNPSSMNMFLRIKQVVLTLVEPQVENALKYLKDPAWVYRESVDGKGSLKAQFFEKILSTAGKVSHDKVVLACKELFEAGAVNSANRNVILSTVLAQPDTSEDIFHQIQSELETATLAHKEVVIAALGTVVNPSLFQNSFRLLFEIQSMDVQFLTEAWSTNPYIRADLWTFIKENYPRIHAQLSGNPTISERFVRNTLKGFVGFGIKDEVEQFFKDKDVSAFDRVLGQALENIEKNTLYTTKNVM